MKGKLVRLFMILLLPIISFGQLEIKSIIDTVESMSIDEMRSYKAKLISAKHLTDEINLLFETRKASLTGNFIKHFELLVELGNEKSTYSDYSKIHANLVISRILSDNQLFDEALKKNEVCVDKCKQNNEIDKAKSIELEKANIYFRQKNYQQAYKCFALESKDNDNISKASNFNNLALCQIMLENYSLALELYNKGLQFVNPKNDPNYSEVHYLIQGNIGSLYLKINDLERAKTYLTEEYDFYIKNQVMGYNYVSCLIDLIDIDFLQNKPVDSKWKDLIYHTGRLIGNESNINILNKIKSSLFLKLSENQKSQLYNLGFQFQSIYISTIVENQKKITKLLYAGNLKSLEKANTLESQKSNLLTKNNQYKTIILMILGLLLGFFIFLYRKLKSQSSIQQKQNELIQIQKNEIFESNQKVLQLEISQQQEQLQSLSTNLKIKKETEENFLNKIKVLKRNKNLNTDTIITELQLSVKNLLEVDKKLDFSNNEYLHHNKQLFENLKKNHPTLSAQEVQFCHYCIFELSSKEIGQITGQTEGAVRVYKNKIKNKMALKKEEELLEYLKNLNTTKN